MRRLLFLMLLTLFCSSTLAKSMNRFEGRLLTYQQLAKLPPNKRMAYLKEVRSLIEYMEKKQRGIETAGLQNLKDQVASYIRELEVMPAAYAYTPPLPIVPSFNKSTGRWECRGKNVEFNPELGTCAFTKPQESSSHDQFVFSPNDRAPLDSTTLVLPGRSDGARHYIPFDSWMALSEYRREELLSGIRLPKDWFDRQAPERRVHYVLGSGDYNIDGTRKPFTVNAGAAPSAPAVSSSPSSSPSTPVPTSSSGSVSSSVSPQAQVGPGGQSTSGSEAAKPEAGAAPQTAEATPAPTPAAPAEPPKSPLAPASASKPRCEIPKFACSNLSDKRRKELENEFRRDRSSNVCIGAGFFQTYRTANKRKGTCGSPTLLKKFDIGGYGYQCKKANEALCNPTVFCLGLRGTPETIQKVAKQTKHPAEVVEKNFKEVEGQSERILPTFMCARISQNLTATCDKMMQQYLDGEFGVGDIKGPGLYQACDPLKVKGFKAQDAWNEMAEGFYRMYNSWCKGEERIRFQALFCDECKIIAERVFAMNQKAIGTGCADAPVSSPSTAPVDETEAIREG